MTRDQSDRTKPDPREDSTLDIRRAWWTLVFYVLLVTVVFALFIANVVKAEPAHDASSEPVLVSGTTRQDAVVMRRDEFDPIFMGKLIQVLCVAGGLGIGSVATWSVAKRKPSMDVDVMSIQTRLANHEERLEHMDKRLESGDTFHRTVIGQLAALSTNQSNNTERFTRMENELKGILSKLTAGDHTIEAIVERRMEALTKRVDALIQSLASAKK